MEAAIGAANWLLGKVLTKLSDDLVAAYVASSELGLNFHNIKRQLLLTQGLLHASQGRDMSNDPGLYGLLGELSKKADEAEDILDELHYFMIHDELNGTKEAAPEVGGGLQGHCLHGCQAALHTIGNWLSCFSCSRNQEDDSFDRVGMSNKIKSVIEEMNSICGPVTDLLKIANHSSTRTSTAITFKRPATGSVVAKDTVFVGRKVILEQTINALTSGTYHGETLSVLPFAGPGGMGKTTFIQHLYNKESIVGHFTVRVWVCVSTDFDVLELTRQILRCIPAIDKEKHTCTVETANLDQLQKSVVERLKSKRFLIVLDDIWKFSNEADWKYLLAPFTKGEAKGSMVLVTTRFPSIAELVKTADMVKLHGLEFNDFFELFEACIFGDSKKPIHYEDDLSGVARDIAYKLKGSPLAANTVGRLLRKNLSREYWIGVLEKNEWKNTKSDDDIMASLKISYDYLPFLLKKCFSYCALFPEDYRFYNLEITSFWTAIGIIDSSCQNDNNYLEELVDNGFLMKEVDSSGVQYYVMHDLLHDLSRNVSSQECANISSLSFSADGISQSIRHLSITIKNIYDESFEEEMGELKSTIDVGNLRTLMIFRSYNARISNILKDTFKEIKGLRVLFIAMKNPESLPNSFSNLIHLQYLKISSPHKLVEMTLPTSLSRFYHLKFLDLNNWRGSKILPKDISRLVNLRHFHSSKELHSSIPKVGKMKCLQELKEYYVKKESVGFELRELEELRELGGKLKICNLESVASKEEASEAKLKNKRNLKELELVWGREHRTIDDDVLEGLQPHPNLRVLGVINPGVAPCPRWLCGNIRTKRLEVLHLEGLSWGTLPSFEKLPHLTSLTLNNIVGMRVFGPGFNDITDRSFMHLKKIMFKDMPRLAEWVGEPNSHLFSRLESIMIKNCPNLHSFPFLECSDRFTNLCRLDIEYCPMLSQLPSMPHTSTLTHLTVINVGSLLSYDGKTFRIVGYNGALAFHNMDKVEFMKIKEVSHISLPDLQKLISLRSIRFKRCDDMFSTKLDDSVVLHSVQSLEIKELCITGELFSKVLKCFPVLSQLTITDCKNLELLHVVGGGISGLGMLQSLKISSCQKMFSRWPKGEVGGGAHAIKPFPSSLRELLPVEAGGLSGLMMLQSLEIWSFGKIFSRWPKGEVGGGAHAINPFPASLRELNILLEPSMQSMGLLSNLTSLTSLSLSSCEELTMDGFNPLITINLKNLVINAYGFGQEDISIAGDLLSEIARSKLMHAGSFQLEEFVVDSISAVLTAPICSHLAATLHTLFFSHDQRATTFTEEQEQALQLLISLQHLQFQYCDNLQSLPQGLHGLPSLKRLVIWGCGRKILCLPPMESLPNSLELLHVLYCSPELTEQAKKLKATDPWFEVEVICTRPELTDPANLEAPYPWFEVEVRG